MARRPEMISKSWLLFELSMYSVNTSKNGDGDEGSADAAELPPRRGAFTTAIGSVPYDLSVHSLGCSTIFAL